MKILFFAAIVLFCAQVLEAIPTSAVTYSKDGKTVTFSTSKHSSLSDSEDVFENISGGQHTTLITSPHSDVSVHSTHSTTVVSTRSGNVSGIKVDKDDDDNNVKPCEKGHSEEKKDGDGKTITTTEHTSCSSDSGSGKFSGGHHITLITSPHSGVSGHIEHDNDSGVSGHSSHSTTVVSTSSGNVSGIKVDKDDKDKKDKPCSGKGDKKDDDSKEKQDDRNQSWHYEFHSGNDKDDKDINDKPCSGKGDKKDDDSKEKQDDRNQSWHYEFHSGNDKDDKDINDKPCSGKGDNKDDDSKEKQHDRNQSWHYEFHSGNDKDDKDINDKPCSGKGDKNDDDSKEKQDDRNQSWHYEFHSGNDKDDKDINDKPCSGKGDNKDDDSKEKQHDRNQSRHYEFHSGNDRDGKEINDKPCSGKGDKKDNDSKEKQHDRNQSWHYEFHSGNHQESDGNSKGNCDAIKLQLDAAEVEIASLRKQLEVSTKEYFVLQTSNNKKTTEAQSCKTQYNEISIKVDQLTQVNVNLELNVEESKTTISNLKTTIQKITSEAQVDKKELIELKHKYEILVVSSETCNNNVETLKNSNIDLKKTVTEATNERTVCENTNHQLSFDIQSISRYWETTKTSLAKCNLEITNKDKALQLKIDELSENDKKYHDEWMLRQKEEAESEHYQSQLTAMETNLKNEQKNSLEYFNQISLLRNEKATISKQCETNINNLQISFNECKESVKSEIGLKNSCFLENKKNELGIESINKQREQCEKTVTRLGIENSSLAAGKQVCEDDLASSKCVTHKHLEIVRQSQEEAIKQILAATGLLGKTNGLCEKFVTDNDITCKSA